MNSHTPVVSLRTSALAVLALIGIYWLAGPSDKFVADAHDASPISPSYTALITARSRPSNSLVFHQSSGKIIASIPSAGDRGGNSIAWIDPTSGQVEKTLWVGSEPNKLALGNDGNTLYVTLDGSRAIRRIDLRSGTVVSQFQSGFTNFDGPLRVVDLSVSPANANVVAVTRDSEGHSGAESVAIFDNGIRRKSIAPSIRGVAFTDQESVLIGTSAVSSNSELSKLAVDASGVTSTTPLPALARGPRIKFAAGRIYTSNGQIVDPSTGALLGTFPLGTGALYERVFTIDSTAHRAIYASLVLTASSLPILKIESFDTETFELIGSVTPQIPPPSNAPFHSRPREIVRWGVNGLAISTNTLTLFIQSDLVGAGPIAWPLPEVLPPPDTYFGASVTRLELENNSLIFNRSDQKLYVSVPGTAPAPFANTITRIDPFSGQILSSVAIGSEPNKLALSDDGSTLYASLDGSASIRRYDTVTQTAGPQFTPANSNNPTRDIAVLPGSPQTVAVSSGAGGVAIYDNGIQRPTSPNISVGPLEHNGTPNVLYGYNDINTGFNLYKMSVSPSGLNVVSDVQNLMFGLNVRTLFDNGRLYSSDGRVVDPENNTIVGTFAVEGVLGMTVDSAAGKAYFLTRRGSDPALEVFDVNSFNRIGMIAVSDQLFFKYDKTEIYRWGPNGLALQTVNAPYGLSTMVLLQSSIIGEATPFDFDGDRRTDMGIYRPSNGQWWINRSSDGSTLNATFGLATDTIVPADYSGDGKTDIAVFRPSSAEWFILRSQDFTVTILTYGATGDVPIPLDFSGDSTANAAVFRPSNSTWYLRSESGEDSFIIPFGQPGDIPVPFDHTGDGRIDIAVYRPSAGQLILYNWEVLPQTVIPFGSAGDKPVIGDYTGDGKQDFALYRPSTGQWFIRRSEDGSYYAVSFGTAGDIPAPGDYDGDGKFDPTVFRPSTGTWYSLQSTAGIAIRRYGLDGDRPVASAFVH